MPSKLSQQKVSRINRKKETSAPNTIAADKKSRAFIDNIFNHCQVTPHKLKTLTNPKGLPKSTKDIAAPTLTLGQTRAVNAIETAIDIKAKGYNIFAVGENGLGKRTFIINYLRYISKLQRPIFDSIYVHNFNHSNYPLAIQLPFGSAQYLVTTVTNLWHLLKTNLHCIESSPASSKPLDLLQQNLASSCSDKEIKPSYQFVIASDIVNPIIDDLIDRYKTNDKLCAYLNHLREDIIIHSEAIAANNNNLFKPHHLNALPSRYCINIINQEAPTFNAQVYNYQVKPLTGQNPASTDNSNKQGDVYSVNPVPIIYEDAPSLETLMGYIGSTQHQGTTIVDVSMIQSGALHRANGGYLLLKASYLLGNPEAWHALKHALKTQQVRIPSNDQHRHATQVCFTPEPIPIDIKVILLGDIEVYDTFFEQDAELIDVFRIRADFHDEISRTHQNELAMVATMAGLIQKHGLLHFDATAQAVILEALSLQAEDQNKLSLHISRLTQLMLESNRHALLVHSKQVTSQHIEQALFDMNYRSSYLQELYLQELTDGQQLITTSGNAVGQINALTIIEYANNEFGMPARLTAVVQHSEGSGDILDIERDVELGGSLHAKGMLIMNSYLRALFSPYHPLNFTASLAFEQSYAHIDGDSATLAEACALLSALADIPISQSLGITGSMNQLGIVQAVGAINAKVAGFYDTCFHQGLTGTQGVILPFANINQLMLRDDIIDAVTAGKFHIYAVRTLSEALTILAKMPIDTITKQGRYRKSSLFGKVITNLKKWDEDLNGSNTPEVSTSNT